MFDHQEVRTATCSSLITHQCASTWLMQDFFDLAINNKTRPQILQDLAELAAQSANISQEAVAQELSFPENDPHPGSNISKVTHS